MSVSTTWDVVCRLAMLLALHPWCQSARHARCSCGQELCPCRGLRVHGSAHRLLRYAYVLQPHTGRLMGSGPDRGGEVEPLLPVQSGQPSAVAPQRRDWDLLLTAETHNFPCAVAPYPGAGKARAASPCTFPNP